MKKKGKEFETFAGGFKNEAELAEELEEDGMDLDEIEEEYFEE